MNDRDLQCLCGDGLGRCPERRSGDDAADRAAGWTVYRCFAVCPTHAALISGARTPDWRLEQRAVDDRLGRDYELATDPDRWQPPAMPER